MADKKEYIEVKKVLRVLNDFVNNCHDKEEFYNRAFDEVDAMPAADVVEVVRCKDCVFYVSEICRQDLALNLCRGDDYCSYGERKDATDTNVGDKRREQHDQGKAD